MRTSSKLTISLLLLSWLQYSCSDEEVRVGGTINYMKYFPLKTGQWIEYNADSIVHLDSDDIYDLDTAIRYYSFQIREVVDTPFIDGENEEAFVILRYRRNNDTLPWEFHTTWTAKINPFGAQRVEDNIRYLKLSFPFSFSVAWNGNVFNAYPAEEYTYEDLFEPFQNSGQVFDSTVRVLQHDFISLINRIRKYEVYAPHAGMIFKQLDSVNTKNTPNGIIILNGFEYSLTATAFGQ